MIDLGSARSKFHVISAICGVHIWPSFGTVAIVVSVMSSPTPLQSFLGGLGLPLPVHALLLLNGNVFGISGFLHRGIRGEKEGLVAVSGLLLGGAFVGLLEGSGPGAFSVGLPQVLLSGLLVGLGSKVRPTLAPSGQLEYRPLHSRCPMVVRQGV